MKLLIYEIRKLLSKHVFLLLVFLLAAGLLVRFSVSCRELDVVDRAVYESVQKEVEALPEEEALLWLEQERDGMLLYSMQKAFGESEEGQTLFNQHAEELAKRHGMSVSEMLRAYADISKNDEERSVRQTALSTLIEQFSYLESYREFIKMLPEQAKELEALSIFSHADSYSNRSIHKSLQDYMSLGEIVIRPDYDQGVKATGTDGTSIFFVFVLILGAAVILFSEEEENGLSKLLRTTKNGHGKLAAAKLGALLLFAVLLSILIFGIEVLIAGGVLGFGDRSRTLQSVSDFRDCCYRLTVGGYLRLSVLLPATAALVFAAVSSFLFTAFKKPWVSAGIAAVFAAVNYLFYRFLSENSALNALKYLNLFCLSDSHSRFALYSNINFFGTPVSVLPSALAAGGILLIAGFIGTVLCFSRGVGVPGTLLPRLRKKIRIRGSVRILSQEHYRLYIGAFGLLVMAILIFLGYRKTEKGELLLSDADYQYYSYGQEIAGEITDDTDAWFLEKAEALNEEASGGAAADPEMSEEERQALLFAAQMRGREIEAKRRVLERIQTEYLALSGARLRGIPVHYISGIQSDPVFGTGNPYLLSAMLMLLILSFSLCPMFSQDEESGMRSLVRTAKHGRGRLFSRRYLVMLLFYTAAFLLFFLPYLYNWLKVYRFSDWDAPVQSVLRYVNVEGTMSLRQLAILWISGSYISGIGFVSLMALLSRFSRKNSTTMILSAVVIAADFLVNLLGFPVLSSIVLSAGFSMTEILERGGRTELLLLIFLKNTVVSAAVLLLHRRVFTK